MSLASAELRARLKALPKAELHCHLEAAARLETLWSFHQEQGETLHGSLEAFRAAVLVPDGAVPGYAEFLARFSALRFCYGGPEDLERLAREVVADAADDGVVHLELRMHPAFWARRMRRDATQLAAAPDKENLAGPVPTVAECAAAVAALARGAEPEARRRGLTLRWILSLGRHVDAPLNACATALLHEPCGGLFAGVDVTGNEDLPLDPVLPFVRVWRNAGRAFTLHAGEDPRPAAAGALGVKDALLEQEAARIGHGVRALEDPAVLALLRERGTPLEICLTSNVQTGAATSYAAHPLRKLLDAGVRATLNTDDPLLSAVTLSEEYARAHECAGLSLRQLRDLAVNGAAAAWLLDSERSALMVRITQAWDEFLAQAGV